MLERAAEVAALEATLSAARDGNGRLVVVEGTPGIGKTRLLTEARLLAGAVGFRVLVARGGELEGDFAFGIVRQLFEAPLAGETAELRAELFGGAAELSAPLFASAPARVSADDFESSFAVLHGLYWLAANFATATPTLLVVDDLHWVDEPSLRWLVYLARRIEGLPLLLLAASRSRAPSSSPLVGELMADPAATVIPLSSLGLESVATLARTRLGAEPDPVFSEAVRAGSGGNPLFLVALLDALRAEGVRPTSDEAQHVAELGPEAVSHGIATRLSRLPVDANALLQAAAILGDRIDLALAATLAGLEPEVALRAASTQSSSRTLSSEPRFSKGWLLMSAPARTVGPPRSSLSAEDFRSKPRPTSCGRSPPPTHSSSPRFARPRRDRFHVAQHRQRCRIYNEHYLNPQQRKSVQTCFMSSAARSSTSAPRTQSSCCAHRSRRWTIPLRGLTS